MPTIQQKVLIEKHMNGHWDRLAARKAVIDNHWHPDKSIGVSRHEHHLLNDRKIERENLKLYHKLHGISAGNTLSATALHIAGSGDPTDREKLFQHRDWQREYDRQEKQDILDKKNLKLYHTLNNTKSLVQSAESLEKEYQHNHRVVDSYSNNKVKDVDLHLHIRRYHSQPNGSSPYSAQHSPSISPIKTATNKNKNMNRSKNYKQIDKSVLKSSSAAASSSRMPSKFRDAIRRPKSANATRSTGISSHKHKHHKITSSHSNQWNNFDSDEYIKKMYQKLSQRAESNVTPEEIDSYVSDHQYDSNIENEVYQYVYGDCSGYDGKGIENDASGFMYRTNRVESTGTNTVEYNRRQHQQQEQGNEEESQLPEIAKVLFDETATSLDSAFGTRSPNNHNDNNDAEQVETEDELIPSSRVVSRRHLFTETRLEARIRVSDQSDSDDLSKHDAPSCPMFVIRMYDVGESCDLQLLSPSKFTTITPAASPTASPSRPFPPQSPITTLKTGKKVASRPVAVNTSSGILIECRLQPETENTRTHHLFISMPDVKAMIKRSFAQPSNLWQVFKKITCRNTDRGLYDCLTDHLNNSLQDQLCGLLAKKIELTITLDPQYSKDLEFSERINVDFKFQL